MRIGRHLLGAVLVAVIVLGSAQQAGAANVVEIPATEVDSVLNQSVQSNAWEGWAAGPQIYSESGIVMDIDSGAILYAKNIDDQHYPASITKILTALVALEHAKMTDTVKFTWDDIGFLEYGDAHIGMKEDEEITMEDALYGMLLASANEVSHAIASNTAGGYDNFINLMNQKVVELGGTNSHFVNANGLHDPEHYTSARDMALISAAAFQYEAFRTITNTYQHTIPATNITDEERIFQQNHKMLREWHNAYYEYCVGGKTGFTDQALTTLVTFAEKDGVKLVSVVLRTHGGGTNAYADTRKMLDYGFEHFSKHAITMEQVTDEEVASICQGEYVMLPEGVTVDKLTYSLTNSAELGDMTAKLIYTYMGYEVGTVDATITEEYYNNLHGIEEQESQVPEKKEEKPGISPILKVIGVVVAASGILWIVFAVRINHKRKMKRRRRASMQKRKQTQEYLG